MKLNIDPIKFEKKIERAKKVASGRSPFFYKKRRIESVLREISYIEAATGTEKARIREELVKALLNGEEKRKYSKIDVLDYAQKNAYGPENLNRIKF